MSIMDPAIIFVYWCCDKRGCEKDNHRKLEKSHTIVEDICDFCGKSIREPITIRLDFNNDNQIEKF